MVMSPDLTFFISIPLPFKSSNYINSCLGLVFIAARIYQFAIHTRYRHPILFM